VTTSKKIFYKSKSRENTKRKTNPLPRFEKIKHVTYVVDRLHIKGHKQKWCQKLCHPDNFKELNGTNTVICEQINYWLN
jgi:hypothetical protein